MRGRLLSAAAALVAATAITNPEEYVNTLGGTDSRYDMSHGNLLPVVVTPWGFNAWAPQTDNDATYSSWWFHPTDVRFFGIRCTHQPSPWISDYGNFRIMPSITDPSHSDPWQYSPYDPTAATFKPYLFNASLIAYGTAEGGNLNVEVTSTNHGMMMRLTYPPYASGELYSGFNQTRRVLIALDNPFADSVTVNTSVVPATITGWATSNSGGVSPNFAHYFTITVEAEGSPGTALPVVGAGTGNNGGTLYGYIDLDPTVAATDSLIVRVATSLISLGQAAVTLAAELPPSTGFDAAMNASKTAWRQTLLQANILDVGAAYSPVEQAAFLETFYSSMYRAAQFPRMLSETAANGSEVHWSPFDGKGAVYPGPLSTDSGFWDAYRTVYPLTSLLHVAQTGRMMQGWVNGYKEGGWLPKWASPGYRGSMVGTMGDVSLADAIVKNITGFDVQAAYAAIRQDAFVVPPSTNGVGRECLAAYLGNGYIPINAPSSQGTCYEEVSRTQNYWLSDFAISKAAAVLGHTADAALLASRAANYSNLFEPATGFFRTRNPANGAFVEPFDQFAWKGPYTEAGPWQYRFYVPHDPKGLAALYQAAGLDMCDVLQTMQTMPSTFHVGGYGDVIHEQTEMALNCYGQYEHNNQPVHHVQYMFIASDVSTTGACAARGQFWLRKTMTELYQPGAAMFCGDEDNGQVASWYILSALGLYALAPGTPDYVLGSPLFAHVQVPLPNGKTLDIVTNNNSAANVYVQGVTWNGAPVTGTTVSYFDIMAGGTLQFTMGPSPASAREAKKAPRAAGPRLRSNARA